MVGKFEIHKDRAGVFRFHLKAGNGEIVATSQGYETKASAKHGIESVKENALNAAVADLTETHDGSSQLRRAIVDAGSEGLRTRPGKRCLSSDQGPVEMPRL